jgi:hypothetical protein
MRATVHLVSARDYLELRPLVSPVLERAHASSPFAKHLERLDDAAIAAAGKELLDERPLSRAELGPLLAERWPGADPESLAHAATFLEPVVQVPPRGLWRRSGQAVWTTASSWLGRRLPPAPEPDEAVLRYLAAFGPAGARDFQVWSGLTRTREVFERLRPQLASFRDENGAELFDLPDSPRPGPETPAPPRFVPEYDNLLLSHADRTRFVSEDDRRRLAGAPGRVAGSVLLDGTALGTWWVDRDARGRGTVLVVRHLRRLAASERAAVTEEGHALMELIEPGTGPRDVRFDPVA